MPQLRHAQALTTATDDLETLIEAERDSLKSAFDLALKNSSKVDDYLQLAKNIAEKKNRIKTHMFTLTDEFANLLVKTNVNGDFKLARKILNSFVDNIHPAASGMENKTVNYNISVIASQGIILYGAQKDPALPNIIFGKLLGKGFDIKTHKNRTLVYNLACFYALTNDKENMLVAVGQARVRGIPAAQFMKDKDFSSYLQDADFLRVVK